MARRNNKGQAISGVVLLDKALGISSNKALQQVKQLFDAKKAGHTGSLDPLATGLLPICFGHATKLSQFLLDANKRYTAMGQLGQQTTTADAEGKVIKSQPYQLITQPDIEQTLLAFKGESWQTPPMHSALKKEGKPLYELARAGKVIEREQRKIHIYELNLLSFNNGAFEIDVLCSKGTYIRTLVEDIAATLNNVAFVSALRRTGFAHYSLQDANTIKALEQLDNKHSHILPAQDILPNYTSITLTQDEVQEVQYGRKIPYNLSSLPNSDLIENSLIKLFTPLGEFLGMANYQDNIIQPKRLFIKQ